MKSIKVFLAAMLLLTMSFAVQATEVKPVSSHVHKLAKRNVPFSVTVTTTVNLPGAIGQPSFTECYSGYYTVINGIITGVVLQSLSVGSCAGNSLHYSTMYYRTSYDPTGPELVLTPAEKENNTWVAAQYHLSQNP